MKKVNLKLIAVAMGFAMAFSFSSCKKYEEGPALSLAGKKGRVVNLWVVDNEFSNGTAETLDSDDKLESIEYTKDNKFTWTTYTDGVADTPYKGEWEFNGNKTAIGIKFENSCATPYPGCDLFWYTTILKLKKNEMWLGEPGTNDYTVYVTK